MNGKKDVEEAFSLLRLLIFYFQGSIISTAIERGRSEGNSVVEKKVTRWPKV